MTEKIEKFRSMALIGNDVYFLAGTGCRFYKVEAESGNIEEVQEISEIQYAYCEIAVYHESLIFVPEADKEICIYDTKIKDFIKILLPDSNVAYDSSYKFSNAFVVDNKVFFIPHFYPDMIIWDMQAGKMYKEHRLYEEFVKRKMPANREFFSPSGIVVHNKIYVTPIMENAVLEIDAVSCNIQFHEVDKQGKLYTCIAWDGNSAWLAGKKETITKWNIEKGTIKEYDYPIGFERGETGAFYLSSFQCGNKVVLIPQLANMFVAVDTAEDKVFGIETGYGKDNVDRYITYGGHEGKIWLYNNTDRQLVCCCAEKDIIKKVKVCFYLNKFLSKICKEDSNTSLDKEDKSNMGKNIGRSIYNETNKGVLINKLDRSAGGNRSV